MAIRHSSVAPRRRRDARNGRGGGGESGMQTATRGERGNVHVESAPSRPHQVRSGFRVRQGYVTHSPTPNAAASFVRRAAARWRQARPATSDHSRARARVIVRSRGAVALTTPPASSASFRGRCCRPAPFGWRFGDAVPVLLTCDDMMGSWGRLSCSIGWRCATAVASDHR